MNDRRMLLIALVAVLVSTARAAVFHVDDDAPGDPGPGDKTTSDPLEDGSTVHPFDAIQEAIEAAVDGDEVIVAPGTYVENLNFLGKAITVASAAGPEQTVIDGGTPGPGDPPVVVSFIQDEDHESVLHGFTVRGANNVAYNGGGIRCQESSPTISSCIIRDNTAEVGGGVGVYAGNPLILNCLIAGNSAFGGAGVFASHGEPVLTNCTIANNGTLPGGVDRGGGVSAGYLSTVTIRNCVVWGNTASTGSQLIVLLGGHLFVSYCDVDGGLGEVVNQSGLLFWLDGNIDSDPLFVASDNGDFRLGSGSAAIDAGQNNAIVALADTDLDGNPRFADDPAMADTGCGMPVVVDMGSYEFQGQPATVLFGDLDGNGAVTVRDLTALAGCLGSDDPACCVADLDLDGQIGSSDAMLLIPVLIQGVRLKP